MAVNHTRHVKLYAYVCGNGCIRTPDVDGTVTFMQVFLKRPAECRYAVVGAWNLNTGQERFIVWDLFDTRQKRSGGTRVYPPPSLKIYDDVDQAIMATMMLYGDD